MTERFITPAPLPSAFEAELLDCFIEECLESSIRATKAKRFGLSETQPGQDHTNAQRLAHEIGDILTVVGLLEDWGLIEPEEIVIGMANKREQLDKYIQHMPEGGLWQSEQEVDEDVRQGIRRVFGQDPPHRVGCRFPHCLCNNPNEKCDPKYNRS